MCFVLYLLKKYFFKKEPVNLELAKMPNKKRRKTMKKIDVVKNDKGEKCIRIPKDISIPELKELCGRFQRKYKELSNIESIISINITFIFLEIFVCILDKNANSIGVAEFVSDGEDTDYFELTLQMAELRSNKLTKTEWNKLSKKMIYDTFKSISK